MSDLVWVLDGDKGPSFGSSGVSGSYILPKNEVDLEPKSLAGRRLWVLLRGQEDRLLLLVKIKKVERIIEGYYSGDYWISPDMMGSLKLASEYVGAARYATMYTRSSKLGVSELSQESSDALVLLVKGSVQTKLLPPDRRSLSKIDFELMPSNGRRLAQSALRAVVSQLTLEQVWANGTGDRLGAFSNFACALLTEKMGAKPSPSVVNDLKYFDPVSVMFSEGKPTAVHEKPSPNYNAPSVDTEFSEIEPGKIYAREFVSVDSMPRNLEAALNKTEHAEKIHQAMLKDISEFLIANGIKPYESNSIDLLYRSREKMNVFEIKSSNSENILSQASKGAFQLACYLNELEKDYDDLNAKLVLHVTESAELQNYAVEALLRLGIKVLIYDPSKPWPSRVPGMLL
ncbi:MAG: hypothetical protein KJ850_08870 [Gammaproteobacteria bacterium]|nr:hypothetical protein [Gammaproteobacteria bacterium]MBU1625149.1 hypothetical protein [Gammaproteobacteria bacterium]MBU1981409.1 hypothetical protein [Gammaproteobacteria bacterium]